MAERLDVDESGARANSRESAPRVFEVAPWFGPAVHTSRRVSGTHITSITLDYAKEAGALLIMLRARGSRSNVTGAL